MASIIRRIHSNALSRREPNLSASNSTEKRRGGLSSLPHESNCTVDRRLTLELELDSYWTHSSRTSASERGNCARTLASLPWPFSPSLSGLARTQPFSVLWMRSCCVHSLIPTPGNWFGCPSGDPIGRVDRFHIQISPIGGTSNRFLRDLAFTVGTISHSLAQASLSG